MRRDPTEFRKRFALYKQGKSPYKNGRPAEAPEVVITPDYEYNQFLNTLPDNQRLTPEEEYTTHKYWELHNKPKDFQEALKQENVIKYIGDNEIKKHFVIKGRVVNIVI